MKKYIAIILMASVLFGMIGVAQADSYYLQKGYVTEINYSGDWFAVTDYDGNIWKFDGLEDYELFDIVVMLMVYTDHDVTHNRVIDMMWTGITMFDIYERHED